MLHKLEDVYHRHINTASEAGKLWIGTDRHNQIASKELSILRSQDSANLIHFGVSIFSRMVMGHITINKVSEGCFKSGDQAVELSLEFSF